MGTIDDLSKLIPPPGKPLEVPSSEDWNRYERKLTALPEDYKQFINMYGTGVVDDFLWVFNPSAENEHLNLFSQARVILSALEETSSKFPDRFTMLRYPEPGGFLPFAGTDNGDNLFWVTNGKPDQWTVAVMGPRSSECFYHNAGLVHFLVSLVRGDVRCSIFPAVFPDGPPVSFVPACD